MILGDVMVPGKHLKCDVCAYKWYSISARLPDCCANPDCRSREWNGKKQKRRPRRLPSVALPKPTKTRWVEEETDF